MKKNLYDYADEKIDKNKVFEEAKKNYDNNVDDQTKTQVNDLYNKYKNYSQEQLLNEFLTTSKQKIKQGNLSKEGLQNTINSLTPYINGEQKNFLDNLIRKIDE